MHARLLIPGTMPPGFVKFASTLAPAWGADRRPIYGGSFRINGDGGFPVPTDSYCMAGAGGEFTMIIPSHVLIVVRLDHFEGEDAGTKDFGKARGLL